MKKIIIPFDGNHFSEGAFSFASKLSKVSPLFLAGIFLPGVEYADIFFFPAAFAAPVYIPKLEKLERDTIDHNAIKFSERCKENHLAFKVHKDISDTKSAISHLTMETRFADLMILGTEVFYTQGSDGPLEYLKNALRHTECPVILVPEKFNFPSHVILAYDGSAASVYAIRQFASLFPELCNLPTTLMYAGADGDDIPQKELIDELVARHFKNYRINKVPAKYETKINDWLPKYPDSLLVAGSFGTTGVSSIFRSSFIINVIREHKVPIFVAHQ